jgi:hypothetical protein
MKAPREKQIQVDNRIGIVENAQASDEFFENLLRIVDRIEKEQEAEASGQRSEKDQCGE